MVRFKCFTSYNQEFFLSFLGFIDKRAKSAKGEESGYALQIFYLNKSLLFNDFE